MFNRKRLARERLEMYLVHLILAYRYLILISGLLLLVYAGVILFRTLLAGIALHVTGHFPAPAELLFQCRSLYSQAGSVDRDAREA